MMKYELVFLALTGLISAGRISRREVPQEHSHEAVLRGVNFNLKLDNPKKISDAVFGLLGDAAAKNGAGSVTDLTCLQMEIADQAFTNAKAAKNITGMAHSIMFRALERNTGAVGKASPLCTQKAVNPEIAAISQHQDPASPEAAKNKDIEIEVAKQLKSIGADPKLALQTGTFAPGQTSDPTAKGNSCDDANDPVGCIISQNKLVPAATEAEILAAVGGDSAQGADPTATKGSSGSRPTKKPQKTGTSGKEKVKNNKAKPSKTGADTAKATGSGSGSGSGSGTGTLDFGSCGSPAVKFADGLDGRKEGAFAPVNTKDFNHGSALKIGVISDFICQQLDAKCKAPKATLDACDQAKKAAAAVTETGQAVADAFNKALGVSDK